MSHDSVMVSALAATPGPSAPQVRGQDLARKQLSSTKGRWQQLGLVVFCLCVMSLPVLAQPPGGGRRGRFAEDEQGSTNALRPDQLEFQDGVASIPDHETYQKLSYKGSQVMVDGFLEGLEFVKFTIDRATSDDPQFYFINTVTHRGHPMFGQAIGLGRGGREQMKGVLVYRPRLKAPNGTAGLYTFEFEPNDTYGFERIKFAYDMLLKKMPSLTGKLGYYPRERGLSAYQRDKALFDDSDVRVYLDADLESQDIAFLPLNAGQSFGRLRVMKAGERPSVQDIVLFTSLPNELSRVAGIITTVRQTPLSHVNLRAVQDHVPNAFIAQADQIEPIRSLIGQWVAYQVSAEGYTMRAATEQEVEQHFEKLRPAEAQTPPKDLSVTAIQPLSQLGFRDSAAYGAKAANLATLATFKIAEIDVPSGYAVPFYFYDEFMKQNGLYAAIEKTLADPEFAQNRDQQEKLLKAFRKRIVDSPMPAALLEAIGQIQQQFPEGTKIRCRSSTNNEDLAGFSGAGLYDSYTHRPDEGHLAETIKQVYASLWNFRAFEEREFYRVSHLQAAMGVLLHPNYDDEQVNGVAVTDDILYETQGFYYVNAQLGEDLVTNPSAETAPEELLLGWRKQYGDKVMQESSLAEPGKYLLSDEQRDALRTALGKLHSRFSRLYGHQDTEKFAMEVEFKVTPAGKLVIKQARPWVR